jgi:hypothetical protein
LKVLILSKDKISQNYFRTEILNLGEFKVIGTNSNQDLVTLNERLAFINSFEDVVIFHALKQSRYLAGKNWLPEPTADYPKILFELADLIVYTPTLIQTSHGMKNTVIKGKVEKIKISAAAELTGVLDYGKSTSDPA